MGIEEVAMRVRRLLYRIPWAWWSLGCQHLHALCSVFVEKDLEKTYMIIK
jgi:hypothetical protein